jgi:rRNA maturation protein Nop10
MIEEWFECKACSVRETLEGKCGKCGAALKSTVK